ncbi:MAG: hypothetical protein ABSE06_19730 [Anaerolineaceae bacterium]|jgi:hypothetical protein
MENDLDLYEAAKNLPENWWQTLTTCQILSKQFEKHMVGLMASGNIYGIDQMVLFTGFLILYNQTLIWFTAGHVIDCIKDIISNSAKDNLQLKWLDGITIPGAVGIPILRENIRMFSGTKWNFDFGTTIISNLLEREAILNNGFSIPLSTKHLAYRRDKQPEGFYVVGFPTDQLEKSEVKISLNVVRQKIEAKLIPIPIQHIPFPLDNSREDIFDDPNAFYGKILDYPDSPDFRPDINGMSGGPIISIERDSAMQFRYFVYGIQKSWYRESRIIRAEPIETIIEILNNVESNP